VEVLRKTLYKPSKSESCTGFCKILLIKETNSQMPDSTRTVESDCQVTELQGGEAPKVLGNRKGCDFGYALADNSCEGVPGVDACTVTALVGPPLSRFQTPADTSQRGWFFRVCRFFRVTSSNRPLSILQVSYY
jgi:hypothetical protein